MKARIAPSKPGIVLVRGVELPFNGLNENDLQKWYEVGAKVEEKYPNAMELTTDLSAISGFSDVTKKYVEGTKAFCELFDGVFGKGTSKKIFGEKPYYGLCLEIYYEFLGGLQRQGAAYNQELSQKLALFEPVVTNE